MGSSLTVYVGPYAEFPVVKVPQPVRRTLYCCGSLPDAFCSKCGKARQNEEVIEELPATYYTDCRDVVDNRLCRPQIHASTKEVWIPNTSTTAWHVSCDRYGHDPLTQLTAEDVAQACAVFAVDFHGELQKLAALYRAVWTVNFGVIAYWD